MLLADVDAQMKHIMRGVEEIIHEGEMRERIRKSIETGEPLRVKLGIDPTATELHMGNMVTIRKLRHFQDLGHTAIFLIGDFTGRIGDPSERSEGRIRLTKDQVWQHAGTFRDQAFMILDREKTEVRHNGEWFDCMSFEDCLDLAYRSTVARMLERNDFEARYRQGNPISISEFLYPLMQGYDSVALKADVELGGTDQKFNLLAGRDLQVFHGQPPQVIVMTPLIEGLDGSKKMSKTQGNTITLEEPAEDMFGKIMSIRDDLVVKYFTLLTDVPLEEVRRFEEALAHPEIHRESSDPLHPMQLKKSLARALVTNLHDKAAADRSEDHFERVVQRKEIPDEIPLRSFQASAIAAYEIVATCSGESRAEARRLIAQGAVTLDGDKLSDPVREIQLGPEEQILRVGKRRFYRIKIEGS